MMQIGDLSNAAAFPLVALKVFSLLFSQIAFVGVVLSRHVFFSGG